MSIKKLLVILTLITFNNSVCAQDGSDIIYLNVNDLNESYLNRIAHLDFYNNSFALTNPLNKVKRALDTISINIENNQILFKEYRSDNGFNNWFSQQYLESTKKINGYIIRISQCKLLNISTNELTVSFLLSYYDSENILKSFSKEISYSFLKKDINTVLLKN